MASTPLDTITCLLEARSAGDIDKALTFYESAATVVVQPGRTATGEEDVRGFTAATSSLPMTFGRRTVIEADGIALHISEWTLHRTNGEVHFGRTTDVLRRQMNGDWLIVIDNPWGGAVLDDAPA